jgi:hypothetical protein
LVPPLAGPWVAATRRSEGRLSISRKSCTLQDFLQ